MGVYIKDMEMPKSCPCELLGIGYDLCCSFAGGIPARVKEYYECCQNDTRPSWCPLVPVPPHGRLGDLDAVAYQLAKQETIDGQPRAIRRARRIVNDATTIIPAEEVYDKYVDTAGNLHWTGTRSGEHVIPSEPCKDLSKH